MGSNEEKKIEQQASNRSNHGSIVYPPNGPDINYHYSLNKPSASSRWKLWSQCDIRVQLCLGRIQGQSCEFVCGLCDKCKGIFRTLVPDCKYCPKGRGQKACISTCNRGTAICRKCGLL